MKKIIVTGVCGFVGQHMLSYLSQQSKIEHILGIDRGPQSECSFIEQSGVTFQYSQTDLNDPRKTEQILKQFNPDGIIHLAALASVGKSWEKPAETFRNNTNIFLNVLEAIRVNGLKCRLLSVGSSEEYGTVKEEDLPLREENTLTPWNPYAVSSTSKQYLSEVYSRGYGMDIVMTRSFNHLGPGQSTAFFIPSIAQQLVGMDEEQDAPLQLKVGNLAVTRDYTDVRDVVKAYWKMITEGEAGQTYNVCSGKGYKLSEIVESLIELSGKEVGIKVDEARLRPVDNPVIIGSNKKIKTELGWSPEISLKESLADILRYLQEGEIHS